MGLKFKINLDKAIIYKEVDTDNLPVCCSIWQKLFFIYGVFYSMVPSCAKSDAGGKWNSSQTMQIFNKFCIYLRHFLRSLFCYLKFLSKIRVKKYFFRVEISKVLLTRSFLSNVGLVIDETEWLIEILVKELPLGASTNILPNRRLLLTI